MDEKKGTFGRWLGRNLRRQFLAGLLASIPIGATVLILVWIFNGIDNILQPFIKIIAGRPMSGVGFGVTILLIYLVGVVASNILGRRIIGYGESLVARVPLVQQLYAGIKQLVQGFSAPGENGFTQAVLVEFPRKGVWTIGFVTNEEMTQSGVKQLSILVPTAPNPTSGFLQIVREEEVIRTSIPLDEALSMVISAGKVPSRAVINCLSAQTE
ncbi:DUF502 domain-containing protein [Chloroflexota bacterium]